MNSIEIHLILAIALGYLIGSVPSGVILSKMFGSGDIREKGSKNIGATNALRTQGKLVGFLTLLSDISKGALAYLIISQLINLEPTDSFAKTLNTIALISPIIGHAMPIWLKFRGGKCVATGMGVISASCPLVGAVVFLIWVSCFALFKISSIAGMTAILSAPILYRFVFGGENGALFNAYFFIASFVIYRHKENIIRLINGTEEKTK